MCVCICCFASQLSEKQYGVLASVVCVSNAVLVFTLTHSDYIGVALLGDGVGATHATAMKRAGDSSAQSE